MQRNGLKRWIAAWLLWAIGMPAHAARWQDAAVPAAPPHAPTAVSDALRAQDAADAQWNARPVIELGKVEAIQGLQPGPGLWKAWRGDQVLYILGTASPLPDAMQWQSDHVRAVLADVDAVLGPPGVVVGSDMGRMRALLLVPSVLRATGNPGKQTLEQVLPADLHARWQAAKATYLPKDRGVERKRPMFAIGELFQAALKRNGLTGRKVVSPVLQEVLKARGMQLQPATLSLKVADPKAAIAGLRSEAISAAELDCFRVGLELVESELPRLREHADAWAKGDIVRLQSSAGRSLAQACMAAWADMDVTRKHGAEDLYRRIREHWLSQVETAFAQHERVFTMLSTEQLLHKGDYLQALVDRGFEIESP